MAKYHYITVITATKIFQGRFASNAQCVMILISALSASLLVLS